MLEFDVKWQGYENPSDRTWEPEENMYAMRPTVSPRTVLTEAGRRPPTC